MTIPSQLFRLQELDQELSSSEQNAENITGQLGESKTVIAARNKLAAEKKLLDELTTQQRSVEWEIDDLNTKLAKVDEDLYSGRIKNPKELTDLQHESNLLKTQRTQLEEKTLELMEQVDKAAGDVTATDSALNRLEADWQTQQRKLAADLELLKTAIADLQKRRQLMADGIDPAAVTTYQSLKKQKGTAVARVEGGLCDRCRITLPVSEMQQVRTGKLVRCGSCGRILFLS